MLLSSALSLGRYVREWLPFVIIAPLYFLIDVLRGPPPHDFDSAMSRFDQFLFFGHSPVSLLQGVINQPLSEWLAFAYSFYGIAYPLCIGAIYAARGRRGVREGVTALTAGLAIAYLGYAMIPVKGPALSMTFSVPVEIELFADVKQAMMDATRITYDCFPSFHTAGMVIMGWLCFRNARPVFWFMLPMLVSTPLACVYLRYHYVADVIAGAVLGVVVMLVTPRWVAWSLRQGPDAA